MMKAESNSLKFLGGTPQKLTVPFFQRNYIWNEKNWNELLRSLCSTEDRPFLGSIILKSVEAPLKPSEASIIDGQQRLTTLTVLAKAILDSLLPDERLSNGICSEIKNYLFFKENASDSFEKSRIKIEHSRIDAEAYVRIIEAGLKNDDYIDLNGISIASSAILQCYKFFRENLAGKTVDELNKLFDNMFNVNNPILVLIVLGVNDVNEQAIFDTINRAGIRLSTADIIKNNLFKKCLDKKGFSIEDKEEVCKLYDKKWASLFYSKTEDQTIWDKKRIFGNTQRTNHEFLLYCVACIKWGKQDESFANLEKVYDEMTLNNDYYSLCRLIDDINQYGHIYKKYILDFQNDLEDESVPLYIKYNDHVNRLLLILEKFGVQMFYPYIIKALAEAKENYDNVKLLEEFRILETFIIRRRLSPKGVNDYADKCYHVLREGTKYLVDNELACDDSILKDYDVRKYIENVNETTAKIILFCIELYRRKEPTNDVSALEYRYTLEHIMPKSWQKNWANVPIKDDEGNTLETESEEGKGYRNLSIKSLGNLTLLTSNLNSSIKNATFATKITGIGETRPGYESHTSLKLTKEIVDKYKVDAVWDEQHIKERTERLYKEVIDLWPSYNGFSSEKKAETSSETEDPDIDNFSKDTLDDAVKVLNAL